MEPLDPETFGPDQMCFGCAPRHPIGLRLRFSRDADVVRTVFVPPETMQGPPGVMHGGLVTALADELAAWTVVGLKARMGFTAAIEARLLRPLRIGAEVLGEGRIASDQGRLVKVDARLSQGDDQAFRGTFTFALLDERGATRLLGQPLPEAWRRFAR